MRELAAFSTRKHERPHARPCGIHASGQGRVKGVGSLLACVLASERACMRVDRSCTSSRTRPCKGLCVCAGRVQDGGHGRVKGCMCVCVQVVYKLADKAGRTVRGTKHQGVKDKV